MVFPYNKEDNLSQVLKANRKYEKSYKDIHISQTQGKTQVYPMSLLVFSCILWPVTNLSVLEYK